MKPPVMNCTVTVILFMKKYERHQGNYSVHVMLLSEGLLPTLETTVQLFEKMEYVRVQWNYSSVYVSWRLST